MRILFVENHAVFAGTVIEQFLSEHTVVVVPSVLEARGALQTSTFDVALVDYDLDDSKGDVLVRSIRDSGSPLPIVAVSARFEGNEAALAAGANSVCHKAAFRSIESVLARVIERAAPGHHPPRRKGGR